MVYFCCIATKLSKRSSFKSKSSSKSKIDLQNETSAENKFQNVNVKNCNKKRFIEIY